MPEFHRELSASFLVYHLQLQKGLDAAAPNPIVKPTRVKP